jgi:hypothetical protein
MVLVEECGESVEVGERVQRPLEVYRSGHGRNEVVPQVRSHRTTRS